MTAPGSHCKQVPCLVLKYDVFKGKVRYLQINASKHLAAGFLHLVKASKLHRVQASTLFRASCILSKCALLWKWLDSSLASRVLATSATLHRMRQIRIFRMEDHASCTYSSRSRPSANDTRNSSRARHARRHRATDFCRHNPSRFVLELGAQKAM